MITTEDVHNAQKKWANSLIEIGKNIHSPHSDLMKFTVQCVDELYGFSTGKVLFKPTKACNVQFRQTIESAVSYFIGGHDDFPEDMGFAREPWLAVEFENHDMILDEKRAIASGNYYFTNKNGEKIKVEYTFGYVLDSFGVLKIDLHHSSIPFKCNAVQ
jgi:hypothetical protein